MNDSDSQMSIHIASELPVSETSSFKIHGIDATFSLFVASFRT